MPNTMNRMIKFIFLVLIVLSGIVKDVYLAQFLPQRALGVVTSVACMGHLNTPPHTPHTLFFIFGDFLVFPLFALVLPQFYTENAYQYPTAAVTNDNKLVV